jgi:hypothetical protein
MAGNEQILTHEEIWDDSALVNSWNEALQEYKVQILMITYLVLVFADDVTYRSITASTLREETWMTYSNQRSQSSQELS